MIAAVKMGKFVAYPKRGFVQLTEKGKQAVGSGKLLLTDLQQDPDFMQHRAGVINKKENDTILDGTAIANASPQDLIDSGFVTIQQEAKTEIQKVIATREKYEWKLPNQIVQWTEQEWYKSAAVKKDNFDLYSIHIKPAEELLFQDIPEEVIAVEFVNQIKGMLHFVKDKGEHGFFNYSNFLATPRIGDLLRVRSSEKTKDGFLKVLTVKKVEDGETCKAVKEFNAAIKVIPPQNFGFVDNVFFDAKMVSQQGLKNNQVIKGRAILSYNKTKKEWGWKAFKIY